MEKKWQIMELVNQERKRRKNRNHAKSANSLDIKE